MNIIEFERWLRSATNGQKLNALLRSQWNIVRGQDYLIELGEDNMFDMSRVVAVATKQTNAITAYKDATDKMLAELRANADDPVKFEEAMSLFEANTAVIAAAAVANTPADPGIPVPPVVEVPPAGGQSTGGSTPID